MAVRLQCNTERGNKVPTIGHNMTVSAYYTTNHCHSTIHGLVEICMQMMDLTFVFQRLNRRCYRCQFRGSAAERENIVHWFMHVLCIAIYTKIKFQLQPFQMYYCLLLGRSGYTLGFATQFLVLDTCPVGTRMSYLSVLLQVSLLCVVRSRNTCNHCACVELRKRDVRVRSMTATRR